MQTCFANVSVCKDRADVVTVVYVCPGQFVYAENEAQNGVVTATLWSPVLDSEWVGAACLSFWHFAVVEDPRR